MQNLRAVLVQRPSGVPGSDHFRIEEVARESPADSEVLIEVKYIDVQPAMRGWLSERPAYTPPIPIGGTMRAQGVGRVIESRSPTLHEGDCVFGGNLGVQRFSVQRAADVTRVDPELAPLEQYVGALGSSGMPAYFGLFDVAK